MKVLVGCERSGTVRDAFARLGHDALSCDLHPSDVGGPHYTGSVLDLIGEGWDLGIFHPPCTYLCSSGLHWNKRGKLVAGRPRAEMTEEALEFVRVLMGAPIPRIAIENPVGCISTRIRKPDQIVQPYQYGDDASKSTCLWLNGLPPLNPTRYFEPRLVCDECAEVFAYGQHKCPACHGQSYKPRWGNQTDSGQNRLGPSPERADARSKTYRGIAEAMASQWSSL